MGKPNEADIFKQRIDQLTSMDMHLSPADSAFIGKDNCKDFYVPFLDITVSTQHEWNKIIRELREAKFKRELKVSGEKLNG